MIRPTLLIAAILLLPLTAQGQVYKCEVNGQTAFQDVPCGDATQTINRGSISTYQAPPSHRQPLRRSVPQTSQRQQRSRQPQPTVNGQGSTVTRNDFVRARADGRLLEGMTESQTISILGYPDNYDSQRHKRNSCKNFRWHNPRFSRGHHYALICNGVVERYNGPSRK